MKSCSPLRTRASGAETASNPETWLPPATRRTFYAMLDERKAALLEAFEAGRVDPAPAEGKEYALVQGKGAERVKSGRSIGKTGGTWYDETGGGNTDRAEWNSLPEDALKSAIATALTKTVLRQLGIPVEWIHTAGALNPVLLLTGCAPAPEETPAPTPESTRTPYLFRLLPGDTPNPMTPTPSPSPSPAARLRRSRRRFLRRLLRY